MSEPIYFSRVKLIDGTFAEVMDEVARQAIAGGTHFVGVTTTELEDMMTISQVTIDGELYSLQNGDIVVYERGEYIYSSSDEKVHIFGDLSNLGDLAMKDSASGSFTPEGSVSAPTITVTASTTNVPTSVTLPTLNVSMGENDTLELVWGAGSVDNGMVMTGATAALDNAPVFTGMADTVTVS